ncbi:ArsR family transcriptional regulator [Sesbania bispinosa]|nr:ArsR family transcriptional regulator [Sesbania bispinosa]
MQLRTMTKRTTDGIRIWRARATRRADSWCYLPGVCCSLTADGVSGEERKSGMRDGCNGMMELEG